MVKAGYKETEIGEIPEDWRLQPIGQHFEFKNGLNKAKEFFGHGTPIINYMDVFSNPGVASSDIAGKVSVNKDEINSYSARKGDVFFTRTSETVEEIGLSTVLLEDVKDAVFSGFVLRAREKGSDFNIHFKKYCFRSELARKQIKATSSYTTRALTSGKLLSQVLFPYPKDIDEQKSIADALSDMDALIASLERLIGKKRDIKTATMQQLLTGKKRLLSYGEGKGTKQTELGEIPEDWNVEKLEDICIKIQDGTHFSPKINGGPFLYITSKNIKFGTLDISNAETIDKHQHRSIYSRCDVKNNDILITKDGASTGNAALNHLEEEFSLLSSVAFLRFDQNKFHPQFFLQSILSFEGQARLKGQMAGNAITRLTLEKIRRFEFAVPSFDEQKAIAEALSGMDLELEKLRKRLTKTKAIKQGVMQELLTGRTRLV